MKCKLLLAALALVGCSVSTADAARHAAHPAFQIKDSKTNITNRAIALPVLKLSQNGQASTVTWRTVDGTARAGVDYVAGSGTLTFGATETSQNITVTLHGGIAPGPNKSFTVKLYAGTNARCYDCSAVATIVNDAPSPVPPIETTDPPPAADDPVTKICSDGSVIPVGDSCPVTTRDPLLGQIDIASNFDVNLGWQLMSGTGAIPPSAGVDPVGAFRFICGAGQVLKEDPIVGPGQSNFGHLHQYYGNNSANKDSTYESLRAAGSSSCQGDIATPLNRSAYWMPALLNGSGYVVKPDFVAIYYKRRPSNDPVASYTPGTAVTPLRSNDQRFAQGIAKDMPNGLKFVFGWDPTGTNTVRTGAAYFNCQGPTAIPGHYTTLTAAFANCPAGNQLGAIIEAPDCWDGKQLDSADHRSHMAYSSYGDWGYLKCPTTHPYLIPAFTLGAWYSIKTGDNTSLWSFSSDAMAPSQPKGYTFHADFFMAWDPVAKAAWHANCINLHLNCSAGDLGNGKQLKGAGQPSYGWTNPNRLVPVP